jgi:hypothetical protein
VQEQKEKKEPRKNVYNKPKLTRYGDIRQLTQAVGMNGAMDGGTGTMNKTSV